MSRPTSPSISAAATAVLLLVATAPALGNGNASANGRFIDLKGADAGTAELTQTNAGVLIEIEIRGLQTGAHGFHVHATGNCDAANKFKSAGDHLAMNDQRHGFFVQGGPHSGDMPNQFVGQDGVLKAQMLAPAIGLQGASTIFDADGAALVVHAGPDDYRSQPSGNSGDRVACAVLRPVQ